MKSIIFLTLLFIVGCVGGGESSVDGAFDPGATTDDKTIPSVVSVTAPSDDTYIIGEVLNFTANFNTVVTVDVTGGTPRLAIDIGGVTRYATYQSGSGSTALIFSYTVVDSDEDNDGIAIASPLEVNGGTIKDSVNVDVSLTFSATTYASVLVDAITPTITSVTPPSNANYVSGNVLSFSVVFSQAVTVDVAGGTPRLALTIGSTTRYATYQSGTTTTTLVFSYTLVAADFDMDGIALSNPVQLNGGTIRSSVGNNATLTFVDPTLPLVTVILPGMELWLDPSVAGNVFTDSACTLPAGHGDPIGCLRDRTSHAHNATEALTLRPTYHTTGIQNHPSILFDGVNDILQVAHHAHFNGMGAFTAIAVILPTTLDNNPRAIMSKRDSTSVTTFNMFFHTTRYLYYDIGSSGNRRNNGMVFNGGNEYLVTMHFDGSLAAASRTKIYIDAALTATSTSTVATATNTAAPLVIGSLNTGYTNYFHGHMGEIIFFNRALTTGVGGELEKVTQYLQAKWNI